MTSARQAKTNLGGNLLYDLFTMKNEATIEPRQGRFEDLINQILAQILERESGPADFQGYGLKFPDIITRMIEKFKGSPNNTDPSRQGDETQPAANINN